METSSRKGLPIVREFEGCKLTAYKCPAGIWTIGWGRTTGVKQGQTITQAQADEIQKYELGSHTKDLFDSIEAGNFPRWELCVQIMSDDEHPELDFDPLDDTKTWPEDVFPLRPVGMMTLNENIKNFHSENEQIAFGTGVLEDPEVE